LGKIFICPKPDKWNEIFENLCRAYEIQTGERLPFHSSEMSGTGGPPVPLILGGWVFTSNLDKKIRWEQTIKWAKERGLDHLLDIEESDMHYS